MKHKLVAIAGGSGSGKSTVSEALQIKYPNEIAVIQLDDYFKPPEEIGLLRGFKNWEHPESLQLDLLYQDLTELLNGKLVVVHTKNEKLNPEFKLTKKRIPIKLKPKKLLILEGYLALFDDRIRKLLDSSIWLDVDHDTSWERRVHFKSPEYEKEVMLPMSKKFALPTKKFAQHIVDASGLTSEQVLTKVEAFIKAFL